MAFAHFSESGRCLCDLGWISERQTLASCVCFLSAATCLCLSATRRLFVNVLMAIALDPKKTILRNKRITKQEHAQDPLYTSTTLVSARALSILRSWAKAKLENVLIGLPGEPEPGPFELTGEIGDDEPLAKPLVSKPTSRVTKLTTKAAETKAAEKAANAESRPAKKPRVDPNASDTEDEGGPVVQVGNQISEMPFVWDVLCRPPPKKLRKNEEAAQEVPFDPTDPFYSPMCWELLDIFVEGWETDANQPYQGLSFILLFTQLTKAGRQFGFSPQLLRQIKKPAGGPRTDFNTIVEIILAPFTIPKISHQDECPRERMQSICIRLLSCLADLALARKIDMERLIDLLATKLSAMDSNAVRTFLAAFRGQGKTFKLRLCLFYLRNYSDFVATASYRPATPIISPRKLGRMSSSSTLSDASLNKVAISPLPVVVLERNFATGPMDLLNSDQNPRRAIDSVIRYDAFKLALLLELIQLGEHKEMWAQVARSGTLAKAFLRARAKAQSVLNLATLEEKRPLMEMNQVREWLIMSMSGTQTPASASLNSASSSSGQVIL